ncbi:MAG: tetratricopeptide repeat protein [Ardenticatenales bacterium]|nr:tetratricopeptide repeat protein [Ardenticatenales bacterium]
MIVLPTGTVTFLFTDVEGSTHRWERFPDAMKAAMVRHDELLRQIVEHHGGQVFEIVGDSVCSVFTQPSDALAAALTAQRALLAEAWGEAGPLRVRMALHTDQAERDEDGYVSLPLNRVSRLVAAGHGGQILLSEATAEQLKSMALPDVALRDLGARRLKDLLHAFHIYQIVTPGLLHTFPPLRTLDVRPSNLPLPGTSLLGREREQSDLCALLRRPEVRLVTMTGTSGIGKTRLGLQVAHLLLDEFENGIIFVPLAPVRDPELVAPAIAQALDLQESSGQSLIERLQEHLRERQVLLLLDNFEHLLGAAPLLTTLLAVAPHVKLLVTSREVLHLYGEREFVVPPLPLPALSPLLEPEALSEYAAIRLFVERAQAVRADFALTPENARAVLDICARLDGLPLAIELAAARSKIFAPEAILARLTHRFSLLTGGSKDLPARLQTLRQAIDWSHELLEAQEKRLFARLGVFVGGCTLEAATTVCTLAADPAQDTLEGMISLVNKSLVRQEDGREGEPRFTLLETLREYAQERLEERGESRLIQNQHLRFFLRLTEEAEPQLHGPDQLRWLDELDAEHANLRAALAHAREHEAEAGLRLAGALAWFWYVRGYFTEGRSWLQQLLARVPEPTTVRVKALYGAAALARWQDEYDEAHTLCEESLTLARTLGDKVGMTWALYELGVQAAHQGEYERAHRLHEESLALKRQLGDQVGIAWSLHSLGRMAYLQGQLTQARTLLDESLGLRRARGDKNGIAWLLRTLGEVAYSQEDYPAATAWYQESLALFREVGSKVGSAFALDGLGTICQGLGDTEEAACFFLESLMLWRDLGNTPSEVTCLLHLAEIAVSYREVEMAARLLGAAETLLETMTAPPPPALLTQYGQGMRLIARHLDESAFQHSRETGKRVTLEQIAWDLRQIVEKQ